MRPPLNLILHGPPGTGKTHATLEVALQILDPAFFAAQAPAAGDDAEMRAAKRRRLKARFDELAREQRVRFVSFHQSFSYEDFVEGLRAVPGADGSLRYEVVDGVFKALCDSAAARVTQQADAPVSLQGRRIWKMSLGNSAEEADVFEECMKQGWALLGYGAGIDFAGCRTRQDILQRFATHERARDNSDYAVTAVHTFVLKMRPGDLLVVSDGNFCFRAIGELTGGYEHLKRRDWENEDYDQCRRVRWLRRYEPSLPHGELMHNQFSQMTLYELRASSIDLGRLRRLLAADAAGAGGPAAAPRVLIIDEINRGNVARIFGELITLIEPDKRSGAPEALQVTLPYSKRLFGVPDNLYLIGTMNSADRSLAALDIALRRRFVFREMPPRPELLDGVAVQGVDLGALLRTLNRRIEALLDREHGLGHAWFLPLAEPGGNTLAALAALFRGQLLPLLQEYFFDDWERIGWVLNDPRKTEARLRFVVPPADTLEALFGAEAAGRLQERRWMLNEAAFDEIESYRQILSAEP